MANLTRWDPFSDLSSWQDRFNQFFNQTISGPGRGSEQSLLAANFIPPVDTAGSFVLLLCREQWMQKR